MLDEPQARLERTAVTSHVTDETYTEMYEAAQTELILLGEFEQA